MGNGGRNSNGGRATVASHGPQLGNGAPATKGKKKKLSGKTKKEVDDVDAVEEAERRSTMSV